MFRLDGKVAIVTGGSRGIGRAICEHFSDLGAYVVVNYNNGEVAAQETLQRLNHGELLQFDVGSPQAVQAAVGRILEKHGRIDILVNNAGIFEGSLLHQVTEEHVERLVATNMVGPLFCSKAVARTMRRQRNGRIINLSSDTAEYASPGQLVYAATKGAVDSLTRTLSRTLGKFGITVNAIAPGYIPTDMTAEANLDGWIKEHASLQRAGTVGEVAAVAAFLASDEASYLTGQVLHVDGGLR